jgi:hypothetical protein
VLCSDNGGWRQFGHLFNIVVLSIFVCHGTRLRQFTQNIPGPSSVRCKKSNLSIIGFGTGTRAGFCISVKDEAMQAFSTVDYPESFETWRFYDSCPSAPC